MPPMHLSPWLLSGLVVLASMTAIWLLSLRLRDSSIADIFWGLGFVLVAWASAALAPDGVSGRGWLMTAMVTAWGLRLSGHIFLRNRGKGEDFRYRAWREEAGASWWWRSYVRVFLLQGAIMWIVAAPVAMTVGAGARQAPLGWLDALAAAVWLAGFAFEAVGDVQLTRFKADPRNKGRVMTRGLWRYTRHPNYFGDATAWWGHYLVAAAGGAWWTIFGPALMTFLLVRVSGVSLLERSLRDAKPGYREYIESTSAFVPLPPRRP